MAAPSHPSLIELLSQVTLPDDWVLDSRPICDLELLLNGAMQPLNGYLNLEDYLGCLHNMRLKNGSIWPLPIVLPIPISATTTGTRSSAASQIVHLRDKTNALIAELTVTSVYKPDLILEKFTLFGANNSTHPYAKYIDANHQNCFYVGGTVSPIHSIVHYDFRKYRLNPQQVRERLAERNWKVVVGFQTRNPMHRSHYELTRQALAEVAASTGEKAHLMITPAVGPTQPGDVDYRVRVRCYEKILARYEEEPLLALLPIAMRMAGPREAVWHAIIRKNYGCTHFIMGRDHAGPSVRRDDAEKSTYYGPYAAQELVASLASEIGITPVMGKNMLYMGPDVGYIQEDRVASLADKSAIPQTISGTQFRKMLQARQPIPDWFCFSEIVEELHKAYLPLHQKGLCIYFTGLPCAGKSTLALALEAILLENADENRKVTVLDADVIRTHLSKGLGFSREDRSLNVRRIGYVASEIVKHGGICLVANIAPYRDDREYNKKLIETAGGHYFEVHVSTPLTICESRDIKDLYRKARLGVIKQFTGISDPYEEPLEPDMVIDSSEDAMGKVYNIYQCLRSKSFCV